MNIGDNGLLLLGCGKMGGAMLRGWLAAGLDVEKVTVLDPHPADWVLELREKGLRLNMQPQTPPDIAVIATKPQVMIQAIPGLSKFGNGPTLFVSIAAGTEICTFEDLLGDQTPVLRAMPNTPAAVGAGITAMVANARVSERQFALAEQLLSAVGRTVALQSEDQMHAVTALSGSGPAYVFAMTEALRQAGEELGLTADLSASLALATVAGAGKLMAEVNESPSALREQVTSPNGTTAAGLEVLLDAESGIFPLAAKTLQAASQRSKELGAAPSAKP